METLTELFDRIIKSVWKQSAQPDGLHWEWGTPDITPIGIETSVQSRLNAITDVKRRAFDKGAKRKLPDTTRLLFDDAYWHVRNEMVHMTDGGPRATGGFISEPIVGIQHTN